MAVRIACLFALEGGLQPWIQHWGMMKTLLDLGDLALIFKVTVKLSRSDLNQMELLCQIYGGGHLFSLKQY